jgi:hypothetical protein
VQEYQARYPHIQYIRQHARIDAAENFRFVALQAKGDYFMWAADDDWWEPKSVETLVSAHMSHSQYAIVLGSLTLVDEKGAIRRTVQFVKEYDIAKWNYAKMFSEMTRWGSPFHYALYGMFRRDFLLSLLKRPFPSCVAPDRVLMSEAALAVRIFGVSDIVWHKTVRAKSIRERYRGDPIGAAMHSRHRRTKTIMTLCGRIFTSPVIPSYRKLYALFLLIPRFLWYNRGYMLHEYFPWAYTILFQVKKKYRFPL